MMQHKNNIKKMIFKIGYITGYILVLAGISFYFLKITKLSSILILLGATLCIPRDVLGFKKEYEHDKKINSYWFLKYVIMLFLFFFLVLFMFFTWI
jgi:hypothetical protein